ncbi:MAG: glycosyltransferase [Methylocystis sp.]|uniref:glycosyltransferase n=1 Tax=Methylocystis sp. TaxID=1911079 RepID=UPI003DA47CE4
MSSLVVLQRQVSQLDEQVYARLHTLDPGCCEVIYWNDYGLSRMMPDPELGVVPDLNEEEAPVYPCRWMDSRREGLEAVRAALIALRPRLVILSDIPQGQRLWLSLMLRKRGIEVALRSDKNTISATARSGLALSFEQQVVRFGYGVMAPVSPLTANYYGWAESRKSVLFPYTTNERKFRKDRATREARRRAIRRQLGIPLEDHVFLSATKFVDRERPSDLVDCFAAVTGGNPNTHLIALGAGPLLEPLKARCAGQQLTHIHFLGFIPFRQLQDYFFAADTFLHLAAVGPWEVSPQDALIAGLSLITSDTVGSGRVFLTDRLARFLVPHGNNAAAIARMTELSARPDAGRQFEPAAQSASAYTVEASAGRLLEFMA